MLVKRFVRICSAKSTTQQTTTVAIVLLVHVALLTFSTTRHSATMDEVLYLVGGVSDWQFGRFELCRGSPPLAALMAAFPLQWTSHVTDWRNAPNTYAVARDFYRNNGQKTHRLVMLGRWVGIVFSIVGGYFCFRWATELDGYGSGLIALRLWCFSPYVLYHGQLVSADMPATASGVAASYMFWRWLNCPSLVRTVLAGLFLGIAELAKFVWLVLFVLWPILWIFWRIFHRGEVARLSWFREGGHLSLIFLLSLYVINLGYGFEKPFPPLGRFAVGRRLLEQIGLGDPRTEDSAYPLLRWAAEIPLPVPENYMVGIDEVRVFERGHSYLRQEWREGGFWYYHLYAFLVKMPLGIFGLLALAGASGLMPAYREHWKTELLLVVSAVAILGFVNASNAPQTDRYTLPVLPFLLLLAAKAGQGFRHRRSAMLVSVFLSWSIVSGLWVYPHCWAYFNELAGGPLGGHAHLDGPRVEWRLDCFYFERWRRQHPEVQPLRVSWQRRIGEEEASTVNYQAVPPGPAINQDYRPAVFCFNGSGTKPGGG